MLLFYPFLEYESTRLYLLADDVLSATGNPRSRASLDEEDSLPLLCVPRISDLQFGVCFALKQILKFVAVFQHSFSTPHMLNCLAVKQFLPLAPSSMGLVLLSVKRCLFCRRSGEIACVLWVCLCLSSKVCRTVMQPLDYWIKSLFEEKCLTVTVHMNMPPPLLEWLKMHAEHRAG